VRILFAGHSLVLTWCGASVAVGSGRSDDKLAGRNTDHVAWTSKPSGAAAETGTGKADNSTGPARSDGEFVDPLGQIDSCFRFGCAGATATAAAATTEEGLQVSAGAAAAAVGKINPVRAGRESRRRRNTRARPHRKQALLIHRIASGVPYGKETPCRVVIGIETIRQIG
jgi:hypothetical protein